MKQVYLDQNFSVQDVICLDFKQAHHILMYFVRHQKKRFVLLLKIQGYSLDMLKISLI